MADETAAVAPVGAPAVGHVVALHEVPVADLTTQPGIAPEPEKPAEPAPPNGETAAPVEEKKDEPEPTVAVEPTKVEEPPVNSEPGPAAETTPASASVEPAVDAGDSKDNKKRKSTGGVPEHKAKQKLNKKRSMPDLQLNCKPGDFYWARLKGYPPWPSIICDEDMLPESLLATRPISTARPDGTIRDDFKEGNKNARERTFPIMFLHTNEFQWMINTALTPLDPEECQTMPKGKTKDLQAAYKVAAENHDIEYYKTILRNWQKEEELIEQELAAQQAEAERLAAEKAANPDPPAEAKPKKKARKSKAGDGDVDMEDADAPKSSKKRKKDGESDADAPKPKKTPKVTKLTVGKTPNGEASGKKAAAKPKKKVVSAPKEEEEQPQMTEQERLAVREKSVLYLRHRLQKGFLSRDQIPREDEMAGMAEFFTQLEGYADLEPSIIRTTKIHKVLKAIVKLASVPKDDEHNFKKRSTAMLEIWNKRMEAEGSEVAPNSAVEKEDKEKSTPAEAATPTTNGAKDPEQEAQEEAVEDAKKDPEEGAAKPVEAQEIVMQDAIADEKPAETIEEKKADESVHKIEEQIEKVEEAVAEKIQEPQVEEPKIEEMKSDQVMTDAPIVEAPAPAAQ